MAYDSDAIEALDSGCEPSCHMVVGAQAIFHEWPPKHRCHGFDAWINEQPGFAKPAELKDTHA